MAESAKIANDPNGGCSLDMMLQEGAVPELAPVSDTSQSTVESTEVDDQGEDPVQKSAEVPSSPSSLVVPSAIMRHTSSSSIPCPPQCRMESSERTSSSSIESVPSRRRHVSFGTVEMKEYAMILGDHPDTEQGPALTIEWTAQSTQNYTLEHFEETRPKRRDLAALVVAPFLREMYLERIVGVSKDEIEASILAAKDVRRQRKETVRKMKNDKLEMVIESLQRKTARFFGAKTLYPFPSTSSTSVARSLPTESRDRASFQDSSSKKKEAIESPRPRGRRSLLRFGRSGSGGSCPDLSASTHPIPSSGVNHRRILSLDS